MEDTIFMMDEREIENIGCGKPDQLDYQFYGINCKYKSELFRQLDLQITIESVSKYYQFIYRMNPNLAEGEVIRMSKSDYAKYARDMGIFRYMEFPAQLTQFSDIISRYLLKKRSYNRHESKRPRLIFEKALGFRFPFEPYAPWRFKADPNCFSFELTAYCYIHKKELKFSTGYSLKSLKSFLRLEQRIQAEDKFVRFITAE